MRKTVHRIRNLIYWFSIIWHDEDFDHVYLWRIMRHKIAAMAKHQRSCPMGRRDEAPDNMEKTVELLDELINEVHENNAYEAHEQMFGESHWEFRKATPAEIKENPKLRNCSFLEVTYPDAADPEEAKLTLIIFSQMAVKLNRATLDLVGELIKTSDSWWD
jgi:hypothetical protein